MQHWFVKAALIVVFMSSFASEAAEANGTLKIVFKQKNANGTEEALPYAYLYLRHAAEPPPMERYFAPADYIFGPSDSAGNINAGVPEGQYYVRVTRRNPLNVKTRPLGPPETGDLSWTPVTPVTITSDKIVDLGNQYAETFGVPPIKISGYVKSAYGTPIPGKFVRVQVEPCILGDYSTEPPIVENKCGPIKIPAQQRTDANGSYSILIRDPGAYYIIVSHTLGFERQYNTTTTGKGFGPVTVSRGDDIRVPDIVYSW